VFNWWRERYRVHGCVKELAASEKEARESKLGLWNEPDPIAPWDWRKQEVDKQK